MADSVAEFPDATLEELRHLLRRRARVGEHVADLTDREFRLLLHLVRHSGEISSREQLLEG